MKKNLLIAACLFLGLSSQAFAVESQNVPTNTEIEQKACQNVFSFINIDLSLMSPRGTAADVNVVNSANSSFSDQKDAIVPVSNKQEIKQPCACAFKSQEPAKASKNKTSLFRIDLLHIFKIQIM
jgi:hypothetical protein